MPNYVTKEELEDATGVHTFDLAAKNILLLWKFKLRNYALIKTKGDDLYVDKLKSVTVDFNN